MLKLTLLPDEYVTIGGDIVVQLTRVAGGRADVAVYADRSVPVVRGAVLERQGGQRPACLAPPPKTRARYYRDRILPWPDHRERAGRAAALCREAAVRRGIDLRLRKAPGKSEK